MILRLLNPQGVGGLAASLALALLLLLAKADARHWKKETGRQEQLYRAEQAAHAGTVANYRATAEAARAADLANAERAAAEQRSINERTRDDYEKRIADARLAAGRLRSGAAAAHSGGGRSAPMPGLPTTAAGAAEAAREDRLPQSDALTATEQAIQLDELIEWVKAQHAVDPNGGRTDVTGLSFERLAPSR
jgi:hypothetical protein